MNRDRMLDTRAIARRQRGFFTLDQAFEAGWDATTVRRWLRAGVWEESAPRVYRFAGVPMNWKDELIAASLSANAVAARRSAAGLYGLWAPPAQPQLLVVRGRRNLDRAEIHSTNDLPPSDVTRVGPIPATTPVRTVIDAAGELHGSAVDRLVDRAVSTRRVRLAALERRARELRAPARPGAARVLASISRAHPDLERARNEFEAEVLRLARAAGLPQPEVNWPLIINGQRRLLDVAWPAPKIVLEFDGYLPHVETRTVFDDDRARQNDLVDDDWKVFRVTSTMLRASLARQFEAVKRALLASESHTSPASA
jgi:very-short-patch-repair endonuclease